MCNVVENNAFCWLSLLRFAFSFFLFFTCYLFFNLLVVWPCMSIVQRVVLQSCVFQGKRASATLWNSETQTRGRGRRVAQENLWTGEGQRDRTALTPAAGLDLAQTLALRCLNIQYERLPGSGTLLSWASRTSFYPQTFSLSLCHSYRHYEKKKKNNINDYRDNSIESKLKG